MVSIKPRTPLKVTEDTTLEDIDRELAELSALAHRLPYYTLQYAKHHERINALLNYRDTLRAKLN